MSTFLTAPRMVQIAVGVGGLAGGVYLGEKFAGGAFEKDVTGAPSKVVYDRNGWIVDQAREPQGGVVAKGLIGVGAVVAAVAGAMTVTRIPLFNASSMVKSCGGALLFAGGVGIITGASSSPTQWRNTAGRPS